MTALVWDKVGERFYRTGIDRGVLYTHDLKAAVWNGLTHVEDSTGSELKSYYLEGVKYLQTLVPGDYSGKLSAFTYPDELDTLMGIVTATPGLQYHEQPSQSFNLSYRTKIGSDSEGEDHGYKIHILYNIIANPDNVASSTLGEKGAEPTEFSWSLTGTPPDLDRFRPTVHIEIDSLITPPEVLKILEDKLYGTDTSNASLPSIQEVAEYFGYLGALIIIDHGDGSWTAIDESNGYISMITPTIFQIDDADVHYWDSETYDISSTNVTDVTGPY